MTLQEYLTLPAGHEVDFEAGQKLLADIAQNDLPLLSDDQTALIIDYVSINLLHQSVSVELVPKLEAKLARLEHTN